MRIDGLELATLGAMLAAAVFGALALVGLHEGDLVRAALCLVLAGALLRAMVQCARAAAYRHDQEGA